MKSLKLLVLLVVALLMTAGTASAYSFTSPDGAASPNLGHDINAGSPITVTISGGQSFEHYAVCIVGNATVKNPTFRVNEWVIPPQPPVYKNKACATWAVVETDMSGQCTIQFDTYPTGDRQTYLVGVTPTDNPNDSKLLWFTVL